MSALLILAAAIAASAQPAPAAPPAAAPLLTFAGLPNVEIAYYPVTGRTVREIHQSVARSAPLDPATGRRLPATSSWNIAAGVKWTRTGERCAIAAVDLKFAARATMPRLEVQPDTPAPVLAAWRNYAAQLESRQAAQLRFAHDRRVTVEQAIRAAGCTGWEVAATAAIDRIKADQRVAFKNDARAQPRLMEPGKD